MSDKIYCYPNSDVLINKLNIHDTDKLLEVERKLTMLRLMDLLEKPISGKFDLEHLRNIHKYIFQDIYIPGLEKFVQLILQNQICFAKYNSSKCKQKKYLVNYRKMII